MNTTRKRNYAKRLSQKGKLSRRRFLHALLVLPIALGAAAKPPQAKSCEEPARKINRLAVLFERGRNLAG